MIIVVIAIIAILAGMLLPALTTARASGQTAACKGNIKNIGMYVFMYAQTYDEYIPAIHDGRRPSDARWIWPFLESLGIGLTKDNYKYKGCPAAHPEIAALNPTSYENDNQDFAIYGYNSYLGYYDDSGNTVTTWSLCYPMGKLVKVVNPSNKMLATDTKKAVVVAFIRYYEDYKSDTVGWIHGGGSNNMIYLDGHADTHKYTDFARITNLQNNDVTDKYMKPDKQ